MGDDAPETGVLLDPESSPRSMKFEDSPSMADAAFPQVAMRRDLPEAASAARNVALDC